MCYGNLVVLKATLPVLKDYILVYVRLKKTSETPLCEKCRYAFRVYGLVPLLQCKPYESRRLRTLASSQLLRTLPPALQGCCGHAGWSLCEGLK